MSVTCTLSLRTLKTGIRPQTAMALARSSYRSRNEAVFDRYNTIRTFFRQQSTAVHPRGPLLQPDMTGLRSVRLLERTIHIRMACSRRSYSEQRVEPGERENATMSSPTPKKPPQTDSEPSQASNDVQSNHLHPSNLEHYPRFLRNLAASLPHLHRPTRDDFLKVASGFWQRTLIRFRWLSIRSFRKFNADDISAFVTWFLMSQTLWIFIWTTTFFSVVFAVLNSLRLQAYVGRALSSYLTSEAGVSIIFESAIVPKWKDSKISFKNVYISRRPPSPTSPSKQISKGHMMAVGYDVSNHPTYHRVDDDLEDDGSIDISESIGSNINWSTFDLNVDSIDVTLSLRRWLDGKGLVEDAVIKGVRGILDRRAIHWDPSNPLNPSDFRHIARPGDFELKSLELEDVLITVYQPGDFRPYTASIFRADLRCLRKQWIFYDFLSAENIVGQFDNCLFSLHKPQSIGRTTEMDIKDGEWARMSRIRIDGVNIDHLKNCTSTEGPIPWITSGKLDAVFDIKFPRNPEDDLPFNAILEEIADAISTSLSTTANPLLERIPGQRELAKPPLTAPEQPLMIQDPESAKPKMIIDIDLRFRDLKAAVPIFTSDLSYVNNALIRPIVAFMNANRTLVPIHCRIVKNLSDFDGAWTMWETSLMDEISLKTYDALAHHVTQANMNRRIKTVSIWSLQMTASAVLSALRNVIDPLSVAVKEAYANRIRQVYANVNGEALGALYDVVQMAAVP